MRRKWLNARAVLAAIASFLLAESAFAKDVIFDKALLGAMTVTLQGDKADFMPKRLYLCVTPQNGDSRYIYARPGKMVELREGTYTVKVEPRVDLPYVSEATTVRITGQEHSGIELPVRQLETETFAFFVTGPDGNPLADVLVSSRHQEHSEWDYFSRTRKDGTVEVDFPKKDGAIVGFSSRKRRDLRGESIPLKDLLDGHETGPVPHQMKPKLHTGTLRFRLNGKGKSCVEYFGDDVESFATVLVPVEPENERDERMIWIPSDSLQVPLYDMKPGKYRVVSLSLDMSTYRYGLTLYGEPETVIAVDVDGKLTGGQETVIDLPNWPVFPGPKIEVFFSNGNYKGNKASLEMKVIGTAYNGLQEGHIIRKVLDFTRGSASNVKIPNGAYEMTIRSAEGEILRGPEDVVVNPRTVPTYKVIPNE